MLIHNPGFTLHNFGGVWRPIPHADPGTADAPAPVAALAAIEEKATAHLARHLASLSDGQRANFTHAEAEALIVHRWGVGPRALRRIWAEARRRVGLPPLARAGRKPKS